MIVYAYAIRFAITLTDAIRLTLLRRRQRYTPATQIVARLHYAKALSPPLTVYYAFAAITLLLRYYVIAAVTP